MGVDLVLDATHVRNAISQCDLIDHTNIASMMHTWRETHNLRCPRIVDSIPFCTLSPSYGTLLETGRLPFLTVTRLTSRPRRKLFPSFLPCPPRDALRFILDSHRCTTSHGFQLPALPSASSHECGDRIDPIDVVHWIRSGRHLRNQYDVAESGRDWLRAAVKTLPEERCRFGSQ